MQTEHKKRMSAVGAGNCLDVPARTPFSHGLFGQGCKDSYND